MLEASLALLPSPSQVSSPIKENAGRLPMQPAGACVALILYSAKVQRPHP